MEIHNSFEAYFDREIYCTMGISANFYMRANIAVINYNGQSANKTSELIEHSWSMKINSLEG